MGEAEKGRESKPEAQILDETENGADSGCERSRNAKTVVNELKRLGV